MKQKHPDKGKSVKKKPTMYSSIKNELCNQEGPNFVREVKHTRK